MKELWQAADFARNLRRRLRFRQLSHARLKLLRLELRGDQAECEWLARPADHSYGAGERNASLQALEDSLAVRKLLFAAMPSLSSAAFRVYRQVEPEHTELIITGTVTRDEQAADDVCSPAMRAKLCGLRFWLEGDVLGGLQTRPSHHSSGNAESSRSQPQGRQQQVAAQQLERSFFMAANRQQGTYLATTLVGFTAFPAGVVAGGGLGTLIAIVGVALLAFSAFGFYRIKSAGSAY
jgi:hypothetical protein